MSYFTSAFSRSQKILLLILDLLMFLMASFLVSSLRLQEVHLQFLLMPAYWATVFLALASLYVFEAYDFSGSVRTKVVLGKQLRAFVLASVGAGFVSFIFGQDNFGFFGRGVLLGTLVFFYVLSFAMRYAVGRFERKYRETMNLLFIVSDSMAYSLARDLNQSDFQGRFTFLTAQDVVRHKSLLSQYDQIILSLESDELVPEVSSVLMSLRLRGKPILDICEFYERHWLKVPVTFLKDQWFILSSGFSLVQNSFVLRIKRLMDFVLALGMLLVAWPFMLLTAIAIRLESPGEILFKQQRVGKNGQQFQIYKFRSMVVNAEKNGAQWASQNDARVTRVGKFIRLVRLDELPQLWNVLLGEMSFIGPRPERHELNEKIEKVVPFYNIRHLVRPGLTGWAQVLYPYGASIEDSREKLQYEIYYIKNYSLWMDFDILLRTVLVVLFGRGR